MIFILLLILCYSHKHKNIDIDTQNSIDESNIILTMIIFQYKCNNILFYHRFSDIK